MSEIQPSHILIVDPNPARRDALAQGLAALASSYAFAEDAQHALDVLSVERFDLVLLALQLTDTRGERLLQQLKSDHALASLPVLVLADEDAGEQIRICLALGADDYLAPPFDPVIVAVRVNAALERKRLREQERAFSERVALVKFEHDLRIAHDIQASFLPDEIPQPPGWEIAARFHPAREVAGDFYDVFPMTNNRRVGFVIADVVDKGVGAALFMALARSLLRAYAQQNYALNLPSLEEKPNDANWFDVRKSVPSIGTNALRHAISLTNAYLTTNHQKMSTFVTLFFGVLDPATGVVTYANCGHNPPYLLGANGVKKELTRTGPVVGIFPETDWKIGQVELEPGDTLITYTDGVTEARRPDGEFFEDEFMKLLQTRNESAKGLLDEIDDHIHAFIAGKEQDDDITMLAVRRALA